MSDLHCPATVLVARHGEAEYESDLLSDAGGSLTMAGRSQSAELARSLAAENVSLVYSSPLSRAVQTAEIVAASVGCVVRVREAFAELSVGDLAGEPEAALTPVVERWRAGDLTAGVPGSESGEEVVARVRGALEDIADLHRGETVLVISHGWAMGVALPQLANGAGLRRPLPSCRPVRTHADADGWRCVEWPDDQR
jgi:broad specificity phosphatase PhoE